MFFTIKMMLMTFLVCLRRREVLNFYRTFLMLIKRLVTPVSEAQQPWSISIYSVIFPSPPRGPRKGTDNVFPVTGNVSRGRFPAGNAATISWDKQTIIHQIINDCSVSVRITFSLISSGSFLFFPLWTSKAFFSATPPFRFHSFPIHDTHNYMRKWNTWN